MDRLARLIEEATSETGRPDFAIVAGLRFEMRGLGPIGELMQHSATVGEALRNLVLHLHLHDRGAAPVLMRLDVETSLLGYSVYRSGTPALDLVYDTSTSILHCILCALCGPDFTAKAVQVSRHRQSSAEPYRKHFGCSPRFDSRISGVVFSSRWMEHPVAGAVPVKRLALQQAIETAEARSPMTFGQRAEVVTQQMLLSGAASSPAIAELFGISERTMRRRLGDEGLSMRGLLDSARYEQARQLLQYTDLPVGDIASTLQYQDANAFSRAFRSWAGCTATQWRAGLPRKKRSE